MDDKVWNKLTTCWNEQLAPSLKTLKSQVIKSANQAANWVQSAHGGDQVVHIGTRSFNVLQKLGEGGYSFVYLVQEQPPSPDSPPGPTYALKKVLADRDQLADAQREMSFIQRLNHPNCLPLLDSATVALPRGSTGGASHAVYMLFPLYDGGNLWDYIEQRHKHHSPPTTPEIVNLALQLCAALTAMHAQGLAHWDVKPHNVLLSWKSTNTRNTHSQQQQGGDILVGFGSSFDNNSNSSSSNSNIFGTSQYQQQQLKSLVGCQAVLIDFGSTRPALQTTTTRTQAVMVQEEAERHFTAPYRPPELWDVATGSVIDQRVDIWSLGCVLYFTMVGESPFERVANDSGGSLMLAVLNGNVVWPEEVLRRYPQGLRDVVMGCLTVDQTVRPSVEDIAAKLNNL